MEEVATDTPAEPVEPSEVLPSDSATEEQAAGEPAPDVLPESSAPAADAPSDAAEAADKEEISPPAESDIKAATDAPSDAAEAAPVDKEETSPPTESDVKAPADVGAPDLSDIASAEGSLHVAARSGNTSTVQMLLRHKADPMALDADGQTAISIAKEMGHTEVVKILTKASPEESKPAEDLAAVAQPLEGDIAAPPSKPDDNSASLAVAVKPSSSELAKKENNFMDTLPPVSQSPAKVRKQKMEEEPSPAASLRADVERILGGSFLDETMSPQSTIKRAKPPLAATTGGVMKGPTYMSAHSRWAASPKWTLGVKPKSTLVKPDTGPSAGTYDLPPTDRSSKYRSIPRFGFGVGSRFGISEQSLKQNPGPGSYQPKDPALQVGTKVGFGTSVRSGLATSGSLHFPGPGAYDQRNTIGQGLMFTAKGKQPTSYLTKSASAPGPGAYNPSTSIIFGEAPKCGFGTSSRDSEAARASRTQGNPGPGAYDMMYSQGIGRDSKKFSATSRRRVHDLNSYLTPGPGAYNAHVTSFGY